MEFLLEDLSSRIAEISSIASAWRQKEQFWEQWSDLLGNMDVVVPRQEFERARENIHDVLEQVSATSASLLRQQKEVTDQQVYVSNLLTQVEAVVRGQTFKRISHPFASREYVQQFGLPLWDRVREGVRSVEWVGSDFLRS